MFLNLEGRYEAGAVRAIADGLCQVGGARKALLVRIPPISAEAERAAKARVKEALELGADGVTIPHVRGVDEARAAIGFFRAAEANVWTPAHPRGDRIAMLMIEDPGALAQADRIADLRDFSVLACGIGSLTRALGNDRAAGEAGTQKVLAESKRVKLPNMLTATAQDVVQRVEEGFLGILAIGPTPDDVITKGARRRRQHPLMLGAHLVFDETPEFRDVLIVRPTRRLARRTPQHLGHSERCHGGGD